MKKERKKKTISICRFGAIRRATGYICLGVTVHCVGVGISKAGTIDFSQQRQITAAKHRIDPTKSALY